MCKPAREIRRWTRKPNFNPPIALWMYLNLFLTNGLLNYSSDFDEAWSGDHIYSPNTWSRPVRYIYIYIQLGSGVYRISRQWLLSCNQLWIWYGIGLEALRPVGLLHEAQLTSSHSHRIAQEEAGKAGRWSHYTESFHRADNLAASQRVTRLRL